MLRFLLALILAFTTVALPVQAECNDQAPMAMGCCCAADPADCAEMGSPCCGFGEQVPAAPQPISVDLQPSPMAVSQHATRLAAAFEYGKKIVFAVSLTKPVHLASNKLYLKKRSLLI